MFSLGITVTLFLLPFLTPAARAQSPELAVEAIQAHFTDAGIVPSLLQTFSPSSALNVSFEGVGTISPGQALSKDQVAPTPSLLLIPANDSVTLDTSGKYTVVMADAGPVGTDETQGQTRHWLVNSVTLTDSSAPYVVSTDSGNAVTQYAGPGPAAGSGAHRYVILIYNQPSDFDSPSNVGSGVQTFNLTSYVSDSKLGPIVGGMYFTVEEGTASVTASATSAVDSSTLPAAQSTATAPGSTTSSNTDTSSNGAGRFKSSSFLGLTASLLVVFAVL